MLSFARGCPLVHLVERGVLVVIGGYLYCFLALFSDELMKAAAWLSDC